MDSVQIDVLVLAVVAHPLGGLRHEVEQGPDSTASLLPGSQFEDLAQQHQDGDHGRRLEIDCDRSFRGAERFREQVRSDGRDGAVGPSDTGTHRDQREHVQAAVNQRGPGPLEERPASPEHDRRR